VQQVLTVDQCAAHIVCRGLVRIRCIQEVPAVLLYLTRIQYINTGLLTGSVADIFPSPPPSFKARRRTN
jgi:lysine-specific histone demethylase 1B